VFKVGDRVYVKSEIAPVCDGSKGVIVGKHYGMHVVVFGSGHPDLIREGRCYFYEESLRLCKCIWL
jgi:hypothetical protein